MADQNIKEYTTTWVVFGFLFFSLLTFAGLFMAANNPTGLGDASDKFDILKSNLSSNLLETETSTNTLLNTSAITESGAKSDNVVAASNSYGFFDTAKKMFGATKLFLSWMFEGEAGDMIMTVFFGLIGLFALFFVIKFGRSLF